MNKDISNGFIDSAILVDDQTLVEKCFKNHPRKRSSLCGTFENVDDTIVSNDEYNALDYVFAVPEIPDDLPTRPSMIEGTIEIPSCIKSKNLLFRETSANAHLSRKSSADSGDHETKKTAACKPNVRDVAILKLVSTNPLENIPIKVHRCIEMCREEHSAGRVYSIHPSKLHLRVKDRSNGVPTPRSPLATVQTFLDVMGPHAHPGLEFVHQESLLGRTKSVRPSMFSVHGMYGFQKVPRKQSSLSTVTSCSDAIQKVHGVDIRFHPTDSVHPSKLKFSGKCASTKVPSRKLSLSTVHGATSKIEAVEPLVNHRADCIRSDAKQCSLRATDSVHPSKLGQPRRLALQASALASMEFAYPKIVRPTITARYPIVKRISEMPDYGWSDSLHPILLESLHRQGLNAAAIQRVRYNCYKD